MRQDRNPTFESVAIRERLRDGIDRKKGRLGLRRRFRSCLPKRGLTGKPEIVLR
jgi:hypothetical protein